MPRRYRRRRYAVTRPVKTTKYSNETYNFQSALTSTVVDQHGVAQVPIVPVLQNGSFLGTRKAKNFTVRFQVSQSIVTAQDDTTALAPSSVVFALVYVPEGTVPSPISVGNAVTPASLYDPNQNVILSGVLSSTNGAQVFKSRLARNLNSNDQLYIVLYDSNTPTQSIKSVATNVYASVNFAIAF